MRDRSTGSSQPFARLLSYLAQADADWRRFESELLQPTGDYTPAFALEQMLTGRGRARRYRDTIINLLQRGVQDASLENVPGEMPPTTAGISGGEVVERLLARSIDDLQRVARNGLPLPRGSASGEADDESLGQDELARRIGDLLFAFDTTDLLLAEGWLYSTVDASRVQVPTAWISDLPVVRSAGDLYDEVMHNLFDPLIEVAENRSLLRSISLAFRASQMIFPTFNYRAHGGSYSALPGQMAYPWWFTLEESDGQEPLALDPDIDYGLQEEAERAGVAGDRWTLAERELAPILKDVLEDGVAGAIAVRNARESS